MSFKYLISYLTYISSIQICKFWINNVVLLLKYLVNVSAKNLNLKKKISFGSIQRVACSVYLKSKRYISEKRKHSRLYVTILWSMQTFPRQLTWNGVGIL